MPQDINVHDSQLYWMLFQLALIAGVQQILPALPLGHFVRTSKLISPFTLS